MLERCCATVGVAMACNLSATLVATGFMLIETVVWCLGETPVDPFVGRSTRSVA